MTVSGLTITRADRQLLQSREPRPEDAISPAETKLTATGSTLQDQELMAEGKHFSLQGEARAETITHTEE